MGVGGAPNPMKDRVRPWERKVETRGVERLGKGTKPCMPEVKVIVDGVRVVSVGEGGKTNNVCEGVDATDCDDVLDLLRALFRRCRGGGAGFRDSVRGRRTGNGRACLRDKGGWLEESSDSTTMAAGEEGTGGRMPIGGGRRLAFGVACEGRSNVGRTAVAGGGGTVNEVFHIGAEGGGRSVGG